MMKMMNTMKYMLPMFAAMLLSSCQSFEVREALNESLEIYPDYKEVTVPYNIAPLNFMPEGVDRGAVLFETQDGDRLTAGIRNGKTSVPLRKWRELLEGAKGSSISVTVADSEGRSYLPFNINVASEPVDKYLAYRLIAPGYVLWGEMGLYQRDLESFRQTAIVESRDIDNACVNCHSFANRDPEKMLFHVRKTEHGGTYVCVDGELEKLDTKTPQTISALVYPSWHPEGRYVAFSVNDTKQTFHVSDRNKIEVYDFRSDVVIYDTEEKDLVTSHALCSGTSFETFPAFSSDGEKLYFCTADSLKMPTDYLNLKYSLCSIGFDAGSGSFGKVDTLVRAGAESVTMPRVSPDGRYMLYTSTGYGNFTVWHKDADLVLIDLDTKEKRIAETWNSDDAESFHSWSDNSRWAVFSTRRDDAAFTRLYIGYIGEDGRLGKPFLLPQRDPEQNKRLDKSYNIPEFVKGKVSSKGYEVRNAGQAHKIRFTGSYVPGGSDAVTGASVSSVN